jgi:hypothetical protein
MFEVLVVAVAAAALLMDGCCCYYYHHHLYAGYLILISETTYVFRELVLQLFSICNLCYM